MQRSMSDEPHWRFASLARQAPHVHEIVVQVGIIPVADNSLKDKGLCQISWQVWMIRVDPESDHSGDLSDGC